MTTIAVDAVSYDKMQDTSATDVVLGRKTAGGGTVEEVACTSAGRALIDDANSLAQRTTLGLVIGTDVAAEGHTHVEVDITDLDHYDTADFTTDFAAEDLANLSTKAHASLTGVTSDQHHAQTHESSHMPGGADVLQVSATDRLLGRDTAGAGDVEEITAANARTILNVADGANAYVHPSHSGDVTSVADGATTIVSDAVTYDKMQDASATDKILGRETAGAGTIEEITCTAAGRALLDDADAATQRTTLGLVIGTDVLANVVEDTTPQLGGNLDVNGKTITSVDNGAVTVSPHGTGQAVIGNAGDIELGDGTERDVYPNTTLKINIGKGGNVINRFLGSYLMLLERSSDPPEPTEGYGVIWQSDGTGKGNDGDIMIAGQAGGVTKYATLFDHSVGAAW